MTDFYFFIILTFVFVLLNRWMFIILRFSFIDDVAYVFILCVVSVLVVLIFNLSSFFIWPVYIWECLCLKVYECSYVYVGHVYLIFLAMVRLLMTFV